MLGLASLSTVFFLWLLQNGIFGVSGKWMKMPFHHPINSMKTLIQLAKITHWSHPFVTQKWIPAKGSPVSEPLQHNW